MQPVGDLVLPCNISECLSSIVFLFCFHNLSSFESSKLVGWLVVMGFNATLTAKVISWQSVMHNVFPGFLTQVLTQLFFPKPPTTFLTCFCRGERRKYARKKSRLNRGSNSQPPGHESDTLTTELPRRAHQNWRLCDKGLTLYQTTKFCFDQNERILQDNAINATQKLKFALGRMENIVGKGENAGDQHFLLLPQCFSKGFSYRVVKSHDCVVKS